MPAQSANSDAAPSWTMIVPGGELLLPRGARGAVPVRPLTILATFARNSSAGAGGRLRIQGAPTPRAAPIPAGRIDARGDAVQSMTGASRPTGR